MQQQYRNSPYGWIGSAEATISGLFVLFAFLSLIPFFKQIKAYFKSPSAWVMWCIILVALIALRAIIDEIIVICIIGGVGKRHRGGAV